MDESDAQALPPVVRLIRSAMSIFLIWSIAGMTLFDSCGSPSCIILVT